MKNESATSCSEFTELGIQRVGGINMNDASSAITDYQLPLQNSDPLWSDFTGYRRYLEGQLCWVDGTPTHLSCAPQRQCPKCRVKWSYIHKQARFKALMEFCSGSNASKISGRIGCAKNTALAYFHDFSQAMEEIVAGLIISGEIATRPTCKQEMRELDRALRSGHRKRRTKACRYLFFGALNFEERSVALFRKLLLPEIREHVKQVETRESDPKARIVYCHNRWTIPR